MYEKEEGKEDGEKGARMGSGARTGILPCALRKSSAARHDDHYLDNYAFLWL